eukprot:scaffold7033_cov257-Pinguiococcus_pyrenoidosus.AAC.27
MEDSSGEQVPDLSAADNPFTQYYAQLTHQQNMLQDATRTGTYQQAMLRNPADFQDKVVLDVGTGTGILAFFAVQAGARKVRFIEHCASRRAVCISYRSVHLVQECASRRALCVSYRSVRLVYAVEASDMAMCAQALVDSNDFAKGVIEVVKVGSIADLLHSLGEDASASGTQGKMEEIELPEKVDIVISEPIGTKAQGRRCCTFRPSQSSNRGSRLLRLLAGARTDARELRCRPGPFPQAQRLDDAHNRIDRLRTHDRRGPVQRAECEEPVLAV